MKANKKIHKPMRKCIGCNTSKIQNELVRIVFDSEAEEIKLDRERKSSGRGAYLCKNEECVKQAIKRKAFERVFKSHISQDIKNNIAEEMKNETR